VPFNGVVKSLPKFANLTVAYRKRVIKMEKGESIHPGEGTQGIVILCNADNLTETNIAMKATFNRSTPQAIAQRPDVTTSSILNTSQKLSQKPPLTNNSQTQKKAKYKQNEFYDNIR
jgi:hypothetical protein